MSAIENTGARAALEPSKSYKGSGENKWKDSENWPGASFDDLKQDNFVRFSCSSSVVPGALNWGVFKVLNIIPENKTRNLKKKLHLRAMHNCYIAGVLHFKNDDPTWSQVDIEDKRLHIQKKP